ncbi:MAG: hypothetical protein A2664_02905 [Candidatus Taylorbacteria bacterium RIFCSPHIGHO2_01_FULL_46_22b]|uniref:Uncharacterized protein n=1 Tax=Candidatus Taylorbacteria bacterium RIFCSPHIGHO2_01_FULL_46_22b TaxID=1802301 RepID=A0A1G2M679_9BACT|nr:MAG: hypothetical protein A2664_02905 [Candidatus Taylorbacteria bacterium RIFCSPHIGHO2_01_FULL_46_22b]
MKNLRVVLCGVACVCLLLVTTSCEEEPLPENATLVSEQVSKGVNTNDTRPEILITNVVRIFLHEPPFHYSAMSLGRDRKIVFHDLFMQGGVTIFADVHPEKPMWISYKKSSGTLFATAEVHIHDPSEINGAGWSVARGKATVTGTTVVVQ